LGHIIISTHDKCIKVEWLLELRECRLWLTKEGNAFDGITTINAWLVLCEPTQGDTTMLKETEERKERERERNGYKPKGSIHTHTTSYRR
jgi:hypothetical protein